MVRLLVFSTVFRTAHQGLWSTPVSYSRLCASRAIIPLNLNADYELGGNIGNAVAAYENLTFRIYPAGHSSYAYYDDQHDTVLTFEANESWGSHQVSIAVPAIASNLTLQVISGKPGTVIADGAALPGLMSLGDLQAAPEGWYWDPTLQAAAGEQQCARGDPQRRRQGCVSG
jgi:hypothetical protein